MGKNKNRRNPKLDALADKAFSDTKYEEKVSSEATKDSGKSSSMDHGGAQSNEKKTANTKGSKEAQIDEGIRHTNVVGGKGASNEKIRKEMDKIYAELEETKEKLRSSEAKLDSLSSENSFLKDCITKINEDNKNIITRYDSQIFRLEKKLFRSNRYKRIFQWRPPFGPDIQNAIKSGICPECFESTKCFFPDSEGYCLKFELYGLGYGSGSGSHISVYWRLLRSENNNRLSWPFRGQVTFTMIPQLDSGARPVTYESEVVLQIGPFQKPSNDPSNYSEGWGAPQFVQQSTALDSSYCRNNELVFEVSIEM